MRRLIPPAALAIGLSREAVGEHRPLATGLGVEAAPQSGPAPSPEETGRFSAYGVTRTFERSRFWVDASDGLLFLFHLHGFLPLARYAAGARDAGGDRFWERVVRSWLEACRHPSLPGWHPYPTSLRTVAWAAALSSIDGWPAGLQQELTGELARQGAYLRRAVERDIGGNHVIKNAKAITVAGAVTGAGRLYDFGLRLLRREIGDQLLADGGHEERSTSYHREVANDLREVACLLEQAGDGVPDWLERAVAQTTAWQTAMAGPDGRLPLLNDAWEGPPVERLVDEPLSDLPASGYTVLRAGGDQAVLDAGPICPRHLPPHAHADVLSFVLWGDGRPLIVDPGTYTYSGPGRNAFRSTRAHNTVEVDGESQCVFWGDFRAAFQPRVSRREPRHVDGAVVLAASHDGYRRLSDPVVHRRIFVWCPGHGLVVVDVLEARRPHRVRSTLHLAPGAAQSTTRVGPFELAALGPSGDLAAKTGAYAPYLGQQLAAPVVEYATEVAPGTPFGWSLLRPGSRVRELSVERLVVDRDDRSSLSVPLDTGSL